MTKPFSPDLYKQFDPAKIRVIEYLTARGWDIGVNQDEYGIDLVGFGPNGYTEVEVEVKAVWHGPTFPYPSVHFPSRKIKFARNPAIFVMLNNEWTHGIVATAAMLRKGKEVRKWTSLTTTELFIEVPLAWVWQVEL